MVTLNVIRGSSANHLQIIPSHSITINHCRMLLNLYYQNPDFPGLFEQKIQFLNKLGQEMYFRLLGFEHTTF